MDKQFWLHKWLANETGFHLPKVHPLLQKYAPQVFSGIEQIFVPLCGKSLDLRYLADKGFKVVGNELVESAVAQFWQEQGIRAEEVSSGDLTLTKASEPELDLYIWQGDFFALTTGHLGACRGIYDRAALVALPSATRSRYVAHLRSLMPSAEMLLISLDYEQQQMDGPPFSVPPEAVEALFNGSEIELLWRKDIIEQEPKFKAKGVSAFYESAYRIRW